MWRKLLADGDIAVALLNLGNATTTITAHWADVGLPAGTAVMVRDLWKREDLPEEAVQGDVYSAEVPSHGTVFVRLTPR